MKGMLHAAVKSFEGYLRRFRPLASRALLTIAEIIFGLSILLLITYLVHIIEEPRIQAAMSGPAELPGYLTRISGWAAQAISFIVHHLSTFGGWYLTGSGLLLSFCELLAAQKNTHVHRLIRARTERSLRTLRTAVPLTLVVWFATIVFFLPPRAARQLFAVRFYEAHPSAAWSEYSFASLRFDWLHVSHIVGIGAVVIGATIFSLLLWSFGFWGFLGTLIALSRRAASLLRLKAYVPIASIVISAAGMVIALAG